MPDKNEIQVRLDPVNEDGKYANAISIHRGKTEITLDFGYILPAINPPVIKVVSRLNLTLENAKIISKTLSNAIEAIDKEEDK